MELQQIEDKLKKIYPNVNLDRERAIHEEYLSWLDNSKIQEARLCDIFPKEIEEQEIKLQNFLGKWGNLSVESVAKLCLICKWIRPTNIFEFGTYNGMTTLQLSYNSYANIYTLDLPSGNSTKFELSDVDRQVSTHFDGKLGSTGSYFKDCNCGITQLWGDSATFDFSPYYGKMDLVFIDAAHDYANKKSDTENAFKMLKKGVIVWDNYCDPLNPECTKMLSELSGEIKLYHLKGTNLVIYENCSSC